jgi:DNA polymerase-3 subunit alpha
MIRRRDFEQTPFGAYYIQSEAEMRSAFSSRPDVLTYSDAIAERCNLTIDFSKVQLPNFPIPDGHTPSSYLREQVYDGLKWRYGSISSEISRRADYELGVIDTTGYSLYFLIVQDYVRYARQGGMMAVPRGSVAGSLCVYALGICDIDPMRYDIMFERFLHSERKGMPDIDMDFADDCRDDVIRYVTERYGKSKVAHVGTFQTLGAKAAVKDVARVMGLPFGLMNGFTKLFPDTPGSTIADALKISAVRKMISDQPILSDVLDLATQLEGVNRGFGTHAAGMLITKEDLNEVVPVQLPPEAGKRKPDATVVTQYDNNNDTSIIESLGLFKFDFLGLSNLSIIRDACALIKKRHGIDLLRG